MHLQMQEILPLIWTLLELINQRRCIRSSQTSGEDRDGLNQNY